MRRPGGPVWAAIAVALVALVVGGSAYAIAKSTNNTIIVCVAHKGGALYKARKCHKHDGKLSWNKQGPQGQRGAAGQPGSPGPQGPGGTILSYTAGASATPITTSMGTLIGDTWSASCGLVAGHAQLQMFLKTGDGSWSADETSDSYNTSGIGGTVSANHFNLAPGTYSNPTTIGLLTAGTPPDQIDGQVVLTQLGPVPGSVVLHLTVSDTLTPDETCHASVDAYPAPLTASPAASMGPRTPSHPGQALLFPKP